MDNATLIVLIEMWIAPRGIDSRTFPDPKITSSSAGSSATMVTTRGIAAASAGVLATFAPSACINSARLGVRGNHIMVVGRLQGQHALLGRLLRERQPNAGLIGAPTSVGGVVHYVPMRSSCSGFGGIRSLRQTIILSRRQAIKLPQHKKRH